MSETFNCPNCGAPLDYKGNDPIIRCPYCNTSVVVPDNLRAAPSFSSKPSNFTLSGGGNLGALVQQARRFKEVKDLAQAGKMDEAVRIYCEITGVSPEMARPSVEALAANRPITLSSLNAVDVGASVAQAMGQSYGQSVISTPVFSTPQVEISSPVSRGSGRLGCIIGCAVTGFVLFILAVTLLPIIGTLGLSGLSIPGLSYASQDLSFGGQGTGPGLFTDVRALGVNPATGDMFAADYEGGRVQAFDAKGKFLKLWNVPDATKDTIITGMAADRNGNVYIATGGQILRYDSNGNLGATLSPPSMENYMNNLAIGADGNLVVGCDNDTILVMSPDGKILNTINGAFEGNGGDTELDLKVAVDGTGDIYALGTFNNAVFKFNPQGKFINRFGSEGDGQGQFTAPEAIAVDGQGRVFVSDFKGIQVFDSNGRYINVFDVPGAIFGIAFDDQNKLYASSNKEMIYRYTVQKPSGN